VVSRDYPPRAVAGVGDSDVRVIKGGGHVWRVSEVPYASYDRRGQTCLIFENEQVVRRVRTFPSDWRTRSDDELYALSLVF
jgi:hypothetical protein